MSAAKPAAAGPKTTLFLFHSPQQGKKLSISEGHLMSKRNPEKEF
jgi:hypothetical protein